MTTWVVDKSALVRVGESPEAGAWAQRIQRGLLRIATVTRLEVGFSAQSGAHARRIMRNPPMTLMPTEYQTPAIEDRAVEVQLLLAEAGVHRAPSVADLLIAATGEIAGLTVLHVDKDFELIAQVTGQPIERLRLA